MNPSYPTLSESEAAVISSILVRTVYKLSTCVKCFTERNIFGKTDKVRGEACEELKCAKKETNRIKTILRDAAEELAQNNGTYRTITKALKKETFKDKCDQITKSDVIEDIKSETIKTSPEELLYAFDTHIEFENDIAIQENITREYSSAVENKNSRVLQNRLKIELDKLKIMEDIEKMRKAKEVEERVWELQKMFLEGEKEARSTHTDDWYERFYKEKDSLYGNLVKIRQEIEDLHNAFLVVEDDFLKKRELLESHYARARERDVRIESEVPFRIVQSWWRGAMVRLSLGKYKAKFETLKEKILKRKEEEAKFMKKLKKKYGLGKK
ncbi:dynein regulatory complex protein 9-like [Diaphorina citri]|jgi:hypothetical protein|uniref:Dynein regulatory complex protein 9-like n=1 Tax=Diaphorina citri TaxID=121845 RepID=A0A3Q0IV71_DIACI|nr:dynein regulatory complex protein 9-like [Diaphorina citri]KAI5710776.1 hypothetical protein M8J75_011383 [Diaphorina citri]KAI5744651.1 hypothetical protein M8J76_004116 [Diaphorina citri]